MHGLEIGTKPYGSTMNASGCCKKNWVSSRWKRPRQFSSLSWRTLCLHRMLNLSQRKCLLPSAGATETDEPERILIGRQEEISILLQAYRSSKRSGGWVGVHGDAGIGKTKLVDAFLSTVREDDVRVVSVRCYSGEEGLAYSPIIEALRDGLSLPDVRACLTRTRRTLAGQKRRGCCRK
jgi:hypothetical protein